MYNFRDLNYVDSPEEDDFPSESIVFNGVNIDKTIPEFRTLQVTGRELMGQTLDTLKVGQQDGERIQGHSIPPREIVVKYEVNAPTPQRFREIYYQLNSILAGVNNKIYFADDPEKYFIGTLEDASVPDGGRLSVVSDFTILCNDPHAYSVNEDEFTFADEEQQINVIANYKGKLYNDLSSNPNIILGAQADAVESRDPASFWWELEQENYFNIYTHDGISGSYTRTENYNTCRLMFKFNVFESINRSYPNFWQKYGIIDYTDKLQWLRDHMDSLTFNCWSYGHGSQGYSATVQYWDGEEWTGTQKNAASIPTLNSYTFDKGRAVDFIDSDGYMYFQTASNPASTSIPTIIYVDYAELQLQLSLPVSDSINIVNEGPLPVPVRFEITNHEDNGFIGITDDSESILLGSVGQVDTMDNKKSERLFTTKQDNSIGLSQWKINDGMIGVINQWNEEPMQSGSFEDPAVIQESRWRLRNSQPDITTAWGAGSSSGHGWHGPSASAKFQPDSQGSVSAQNFTARFYVQNLFGNMRESGLQNCNLWGPNQELLVSVEQWKDVNNHTKLSIRIGDNWALFRQGNGEWDNFFGSILVKRFGNNYTVSLENVEGSGPKTKQTITYTDPTSAKVLCTGMTYWKARWGNTTNYNNVMWNDLYDFWFQKDNVDEFVDIPNTFADGDTVNIDGGEYKVETSVNGTQMLILQNIASKPIMAKPGDNIVNFLYSDFARRPDVKAYIRKKYL